MNAVPSAPSCEPNVTPMLDVLLVLLVIFMTVCIGGYHTMDAVLPQPCAGVCEGTTQVVLEVLPGPTYRINRTLVIGEELPRTLAAIFGARPEKTIQLAGHPGTRYQDVITAIDIARSSGVRVVGISPRASYLSP